VAVRRGVVIVLTLIALAVMVSFGGVVFLYLLISRGPSIQDDSTLVLRPGGALQETLPDDVVGQLMARDTMTVRSFVESLRLAKRDPRITGVLLMPASLDSPFWGKVQELRDAVLDFRSRGRWSSRFSSSAATVSTTWRPRRTTSTCCRRARST